jgi:hypothetical protein
LSEYGSYDKTPLTFEVTAEGQKTFDIKLKRNPKDPSLKK